eukprot:12928191-Ditylum_brightwellii.AAC.1
MSLEQVRYPHPGFVAGLLITANILLKPTTDRHPYNVRMFVFHFMQANVYAPGGIQYNIST